MVLYLFVYNSLSFLDVPVVGSVDVFLMPLLSAMLSLKNSLSEATFTVLGECLRSESSLSMNLMSSKMSTVCCC